MTEKELEKYKSEIIAQLKLSLENNLGQKLTPELATGFFNVIVEKVNAKASNVQG